MTTREIQEQIDSIKRVTEKLLQSKEASLEFLTQAGIMALIEDSPEDSEDSKPKK